MLNPEIGKTAGLVWQHLATNGKSSITNLQNKTMTNPEILNQAIGWLAREDKIHLDRDAKNTYVRLTETESMKHKPTAGDWQPPQRAVGGDEVSECGAGL